ncbi:MAG: hypothetical protein GQF41_2651 [Candidatus Rifleibacterium amylolyticum]|nr:MAG: hypothetical protein GQF41_2651 [Candidatus Rifleibacterium amylolyticum]NLF97054.1 hypothetical protein [Candidatus Riflebacteria bacterium]
MLRSLQLKTLLGLLLFAILFTVSDVQAGVFSDIKLWVSEQANIRQHSKNITSEVKTLYRERKSIQRFAEGASNLIKVYQSIRNKNLKTNFPKLLDIARSISQVVTEFSNLAPKAEAMYKKAQPSMKYFAELADQTQTIQTVKKKIVVKTFSENRLMSLAGANGWNRVFDAVKENPINLFKWGRLSDEYKLGKIEGQYPLKCAQIAFEASGYYFAAKESMQDLLGIQSEIKGILGGDLNSILNLGNTVNKIQNSGNSIESIGELAQEGTNKLSMRMTELVKLQEEYVAASKIYNQKYNKSESSGASSPGNVTTSPARNAPSTSSSASSPASGASTSVYSPNSRTPRPTANTTSSVPAVSLQQAMANYQVAYEAYIKISQAGKASQAEVNAAIEKLAVARKQVEQAKASGK